MKIKGKTVQKLIAVKRGRRQEVRLLGRAQSGHLYALDTIKLNKPEDWAGLRASLVARDQPMLPF